MSLQLIGSYLRMVVTFGGTSFTYSAKTSVSLCGPDSNIARVRHLPRTVHLTFDNSNEICLVVRKEELRDCICRSKWYVRVLCHGQGQWEHGLMLLAKHGPRVPATSALNLLPDVLEIAKMQQYFTTRMRTAQSELYASRISSALRKTVDDETQMDLRLDARNRNVLITEERVCGVCHKRFGGSAIKVMPE